MREYTIDGKTYVQKRLVGGQTQQLVRIMKGISFPDDLTIDTLIDVMGDKLYAAIAVVITEKGCFPKDKDIEAMAEHLKWTADLETDIGIIKDFFALNPTSLILKEIGVMIMALKQKMRTLGPGSMKPSSSSPVETSQSETQSSGDIPSENAKDG
jgi:hypothetical protein